MVTSYLAPLELLILLHWAEASPRSFLLSATPLYLHLSFSRITRLFSVSALCQRRDQMPYYREKPQCVVRWLGHIFTIALRSLFVNAELVSYDLDQDLYTCCRSDVCLE
jgi:hypothetical protein